MFAEENQVLRCQKIFFDVFSIKSTENNSYKLDMKRVLIPSMKWVLEGNLKNKILKKINTNPNFYIKLNNFSKSILMNPNSPLAGVICTYRKRLLQSDVFKQCKSRFDLIKSSADIINSDDHQLKNELEKSITGRVKKNKNKIELIKNKKNKVVVVNTGFTFNFKWWSSLDVLANKQGFNSLICSTKYIEPKNPVGYINYECSYIRLQSYDLGLFNYDCRRIKINVDYSDKQGKGEKVLEAHNKEKFGFWVYPTRIEGSQVRIIAYCDYNKTNACKDLIKKIEEENNILKQELIDGLDSISNTKKNNEIFCKNFEGLLLLSINNSDRKKSIMKYELDHLLSKLEKKLKMLYNWSKYIYVESINENADKDMNMSLVGDIKAMKSFYIKVNGNK